MASKKDRQEYDDALQALDRQNAPHSWPKNRAAAQRRAETALVNLLCGRPSEKGDTKR